MSDFIDPVESDLHKLAMAIRYDLTAAQGKLTELMRQIGTLPPSALKPTAMWNGPSHYVPGGPLRYLPSARTCWNVTDPDRREKATREWLEGFTDDEAEIEAHLDELKLGGPHET